MFAIPFAWKKFSTNLFFIVLSIIMFSQLLIIVTYLFMFCASVVIHLGSAANVSESLHRLQNEVRPLYKLSKLASCPRDFKRTTVDRLFRQLNFEMDWCAFRLVSYKMLIVHLL